MAVEGEGLVKSFGTSAAVDGVDLEVGRGEIFGVLGPDGAGKTTKLRMLATLLPIDAGEAHVFGVEVAREPHRVRQLVGVTGQYASVDEDLTTTENLWLFGRLQGPAVGRRGPPLRVWRHAAAPGSGAEPDHAPAADDGRRQVVALTAKGRRSSRRSTAARRPRQPRSRRRWTRVARGA